MPDTGYRLTRKQLEIVEKWKIDHDAAMECYSLEEVIGNLTSLFMGFESRMRRRRERVYLGQLAPDSAVDADEREICRLWDAVAEVLEAELWSREQDYDVAGAEAFRECRLLAKKCLAEWSPAKPTAAIGGRVDVLDAETADELSAILRGDKQTGRPATVPRALPEGDAQKLRRRGG